MTDANATKPKDDPADALEREPDPAGASLEDPSGADAGRSEEESPEALRERIAALEEALLRARAEVQNVQRRAANERTDAVRFGNAELLKTLVPVLDDLDRAVLHATEQAEVTALLEGIKLVRENLLKALAAFGLEPIDAAGQPFDPRLHEALMKQPCAGQVPGTVIEEVAKGYRLHERTLRPAKVIVAAEVENQPSVPSHKK